MRILFACLAAAAVVVPIHRASACPPPPPGWVPPTEFEHLKSFVDGASDIAYGIITETTGQRSRFKVIHVYRGTARKGDTIETVASWDYPVPFCAGMMSPPLAKPVGTYGVATFRNGSPELNFIPMKHVETMIAEGWIKSARAAD